MTLRAMGPYNGTLPVPTGMIVSFLRDPKTMPYLRYAQLVPAPEIVFSYFRVDPDDINRLPRLNDFSWAYDDYRPTGKGFQLRGEFVDDRTARWDFPYQIGEATRRVWQKGAGIDPKVMYDDARAVHAQLHRAVRVVNGLTNASWAANNTARPYELLGEANPVYFDQSSGQETLPSGNPNPKFQVIKRTFNRIKRRIHLATNGALTGRELVAVIPVAVAQAMAVSGEIVNFIKQSPYAKELTDPNIEEWNLPPSYAGFKLVVEDTPRCFIDQNADGTVADVTLSTEKDYILNTDTIFFTSRPGGLDGNYGSRAFSTVQIYHFNGEARVEAFSEPKHELMEGHVVMEDKVVLPALNSGFKLYDVLA